jgi:hypothetical protein
MMTDTWLPSIEQIAVSAGIHGAAVIGFIGVTSGSGVTTMARAVADSLALSNRRVLLMDLSQPPRDDAPMPYDEGELWERTMPGDSGLDTMIAAPRATMRFQFNNVGWFHAVIDQERADVSHIVLDLPPLTPERADLINPLAAASCCDAVVLVCARGRVGRGEVDRAMDQLATARARVVGAVLNDVDYVSPGMEVARAAHRIRWLSPRLARWAERRALTTDLLR